MAVSFIGATAQVVSNDFSNQNISWPLPSGVTTDDLLIIYVTDGRAAGEPSGTIPAATGYVAHTSVLGTYSTNSDRRETILYKVAGASEGAPSVTTVGYSGADSVTFSGELLAYRGVDTASPFDVTPIVSVVSASGTLIPTSITTITDGAMAMSFVHTIDDNNLAVSNDQGFSTRISGANYDWTAGDDGSHGVADKIVSPAALTTMPTWSVRAAGSDPWSFISTALKPASEAPPPAGPYIGNQFFQLLGIGT